MRKGIMLLILAMGVCFFEGCATQSEVEELNEQILNLKSDQISTISEQVSNITLSLQELQELYKVLPAEDAELEARISELTKYVSVLDSMDKHIDEVDELGNRLSDDLVAMREWIAATFSTLEQHQSTCEELSRVKACLDTLDTSLRNAIDEKLLSSETGIKTWVNEKLTGYYTIAEIEAKLNALSQQNEDSVTVIRSEIAKAKKQLTESYQEEIKTAIEKSEGRLSSKIDSINLELTSRISAIEDRLDLIESRLDDLEKEFSIVILDVDSLSCMPGKSIRVDYKLINSTGECQIECIGENGWSGSVFQETSTVGYITITAPDNDLDGKVLVFAHCGNKMAMKALYFESGVLNVTKVYHFGWQKQSVIVPVESNVDYTVVLGGESWISFAKEAGTKAFIRTDYYTLNVNENPEDSPSRSAIIKFYNELGQLVESITIYQDLSPTSDPIWFNDQYAKQVCVQKYDANGDGELSYYEAGKVTEFESDFFGEYRSAVTSFDEFVYFVSLKEIPGEAFRNVARLTSISLPDSIKNIGLRAFSRCSDLQSANLPNSLERIESQAFYDCQSLSDMSFPPSLLFIGSQAFEYCSSFQEIRLNEGLQEIGKNAFSNCQAVVYIYVPTTIKAIASAFYGTTGKAIIHGEIPDGKIETGAYRGSYFSEVFIGNDVTSIGAYAFYQSRYLSKVTIGKNVSQIGSSAFNLYESKPDYYFRRFLPASGCPSDRNKFYVPEGSKEIYKAAVGWPSEDSLYEEYVVE